jgi:hypothetical protein
MIKDVYLRLLFIPLPGIFLPLVTGLTDYDHYPLSTIILVNLYFISTSFITWTGCSWIHSVMRPVYLPLKPVVRRVLPVCIASTVYGGCIGCLAALGWLRLSQEYFDWNPVISFTLACMLTVIVFTLVYEIRFLSKERERDSIMVDLLNKERSQATLYALQNEMDPHFIFNALNTLNYLIQNNPKQAYLYNNKLAQVYKYFLVNKNKDLVPLGNELDFIADYYYLLQLRYDQKLQLEIELKNESPEELMIPPCSLQVLLENAIKHNSFTDTDPLKIMITVNGQYIKVMNKKSPKPFLIDSTRIGLENLNSRYRLLFNKDIIINTGKDIFTVNLPVIR